MSEGNFWNRLKGTLQPKHEEAPRQAKAAAASPAAAPATQKLELAESGRPFAGPSIVHQKAPPPKGSKAAADDSEYKRDRIRTRYFKARFTDVALPVPGSNDPTAMIRAARLFYEDGDSARAVELLQVVAGWMPDQARVLLAKLQIHFLCHDGAGYVATAKRFNEHFRGAAEWADIQRMGRRLVPGEALFADAPAGDAEGGAQPGAWPEALNWIEASRDTSGDAVALDFRARTLSLSPFAGGGHWR